MIIFLTAENVVPMLVSDSCSPGDLIIMPFPVVKLGCFLEGHIPGGVAKVV